MMPLASQFISISYLMLLGAIWGFLWEFLEALLPDRKKGAIILIIFMLPISMLIWYIANAGALRYYVPIAILCGILIFSLISRQTIGFALALAVKRILSALWLMFILVWVLLKLGIEGVGLLVRFIYRKINLARAKTVSD